MSDEGNSQLSTPQRGVVYLHDEKTPREFQEMTPRSTRQRVSPHSTPFIGEVYLGDEKTPKGFQDITPRSTRQRLSPRTSPRSSPHLSPHRDNLKNKDETSPRTIQQKSPRSKRQDVSPRLSPNRVDACLKNEKSQRAVQEQAVSHQSSPRLSPNRRDVSLEYEKSPRVCQRSPNSKQKLSPRASPKQVTSPSRRQNRKMQENAEDIGGVYHYEHAMEPNKALEPWFRMLHTVDHIDSYQPKDKSKMKGDVFKNIRDLARLAFRIPEEEMNDDVDKYTDDNKEDVYIASEDESLQEYSVELGTHKRMNHLQTESQDFDNVGKETYEEDFCQRDEVPETEESDFQDFSYDHENANEFTGPELEEEYEDTDPQLSTATNEEQPLLNLLEAEFNELTNPVLEAAHTILMKHSNGAYNIRGTDIYLQKTLDWAMSQFSGPSRLSPSETMVRALTRWEPELAAASRVKILKHTSPKKYSPKLELSKFKQGVKTNAIIDTAHNLAKDFNPELYVPHLCNKMFKETLKWALSKYSGPSKLSFDKILLKILLGLEKELNDAVGLNLTPLPDVKEIQRKLPKSNPTVVTAQMMTYILAPEAGDVQNADELSYQMLLKSLQWALKKYGSPSIRDPLIKSMTALINAEPYLEEAFENRN